MTAPVGYSGKPLAAKLGVRAGSRVLLVGAPAGFDLAAPAGAVVRSRPGRDTGKTRTTWCWRSARTEPRCAAGSPPSCRG